MGALEEHPTIAGVAVLVGAGSAVTVAVAEGRSVGVGVAVRATAAVLLHDVVKSMMPMRKTPQRRRV